MSAAIRILPDQVINQIAAGEVVERPLNLVKELVENAIDAGATRIDVRIEAGGKRLVAVEDDGCGMGRQDALLAIERHATSKIEQFDDLHRIASMGFRGEALPSIAAVSQMRLLTRRSQDDAGTLVRVDGGQVCDYREEAANPGTLIEVHRLFYNVPARRKFLRTTATEQALILAHIQAFALAFPEIQFRLYVDERLQLRFPAGELRSRVAQVFGAEHLDHLQFSAVEGARGQLCGFYSRPDWTRSRRDMLFLFVNRRLVRDRLLGKLVLDAYRDLIPRGRFPLGALFLEINPELVDVNVHPTKTEVRFFDIGAVEDLVHRGCRAALETQGASRDDPSPVPEQPNESAEHQMGAYRDQPASQEPARPMAERWYRSATGRGAPGDRLAEDQVAETPVPIESPPDFSVSQSSGAEQLCTGESGECSEHPVRIEVLGQFSDSFVLALVDEDLLIADQHAAMERINFEELEDACGAEGLESQPLLFPHRLPLSVADQDVLGLVRHRLEELGFLIEFIDGAACLVAAPRGLEPQSAVDAVAELATGLDGGSLAQTPADELRRAVLKSMACQRSVKANRALSRIQMTELLERLFRCRLPYTCPHGRPVLLRWTREKLWKEFLRG